MAGQPYDIVMLVLNEVTFDSRVQREAAALAEAGWRVLVIGTQRADGTLPEHDRLRGTEVWHIHYGRLGAGLWWPWRRVRHLLQAFQVVRVMLPIRTRAYHAHNLPALTLITIVRVLRRTPTGLIYDSHELYLFQPHPNTLARRAWNWGIRPLAMRAESRMARRADAVLVVSTPIARALRAWYKVRLPIVIHNIPPTEVRDLPAPFDLRAVVSDCTHVIVHTGDVTNSGRCLTELVQAVALLPEDVALVFVGRGTARADLSTLADRLGIAERVRFVPPVPPEQVVAAIRPADAAIALLRPELVHIRATLPDKLFEALAAGLPVVTSNGFAMRRLVQQFTLGQVCDPTDPEAIACALRDVLSPEAQTRYRSGVRAAQQALTWDAQADRLRAIYREVLR